MGKNSTLSDPQKKYWWLLLIIVPIILAFIAILPQFLKKESSQIIPSSQIVQENENVTQSSGQGNNVNNVVGNVTITSTPSSAEKKP